MASFDEVFNHIETFRHKSTRRYYNNSYDDISYARRVTEDYEKFIFEMIHPYCEEVTQQIIPKELLSRALTTYKAEHPEEWDMIMEKYISHTERGDDDEDDN